MRAVATLLFVLAGSGAASAEDGPIRTDELKPLVKEMFVKLMACRAGRREQDDLIAEYAARAGADGESRVQAIHLYLYSQLLFVLRRADEGTKSLEAALLRFPDFPDVHIALGRIALTGRDFDAAREHARQAREIDSESFEALLFAGAVLQAEGKWAEALVLFKQAAETDETSPQLAHAMAWTYTELFKRSRVEDRRKEYSERARAIADGWVARSPDAAPARLFQSQIYFELGLYAEAAAKLEATLTEVRLLSEQDRKLCLGRIFLVRVNEGDVERAKLAMDRVLELSSLTPVERKDFERRRADLATYGKYARFVWDLENWIRVVGDTGEWVPKRLDAMRKVLALLSEREFLINPVFKDIIQKAYVTCIKTLKDAPPEISVEILQFFRRRHKDPLLLRVIVHFVYPAGLERKVTAEVRVEATRTLAEVGGKAALPTLLYTLSDDSLAVSRAIDVALSGITERRSPIGAGAGPVTAEEQKLLRIKWIEWARSDAGAEQLAQGIRDLEKSISINSKFHRAQQKNPLGDHVMAVVLLDNDMPWSAWKVAYGFLSRYYAKDFLPPEMRVKEITEEFRPVIVKRAQNWWNGDEE